MTSRTTRTGLLVAGLAIAGGVVAAAPASADPSGTHGQGGAHTNRYHAQACQQGGHQARVEAETGRAFTNAGDCTSHTALGGALGAADGQLTLSSSVLYPCPAPSTDACWGEVSAPSIPDNSFVLVAKLGGGWQTSFPGTNGSYSGPANIPCAVSVAATQFYAFVPGVGSTGNVTPPACR